MRAAIESGPWLFSVAYRQLRLAYRREVFPYSWHQEEELS